MESFGGSFFKVYSDELYRYCGYETETPGFARVWVARPDLFMVYMGAMMRAGIIEDCSFARMAGHVDRIFDTGNTENHRFEQVEGATSGGRFDRGRNESGI